MLRLVVLSGVVAFGILDQLIKQYFIYHPTARWDFFDNTIMLMQIKNSGIAFGIQIDRWLILGLTLIIVTALLVFLLQSWRDKNANLSVLLVAILIGALSNSYDRIAHGAVIDYVTVANLNSFNLADILITVGVLAAIYYYAGRPKMNSLNTT